jgi:perosamine synthetase
MTTTLEQTRVETVASSLAETELAVQGGSAAVTSAEGNLFTWPIVTAEDESAVLDVLRRGAMSATDVTLQFEQEFAEWQGSRYALGFNNGTSSLQAALYGAGVGVGDEVICTSVTYWASALPSFSLGATVVFADIDENTLCIDPADIEHRITPNTKAIVTVHYLGHPCDMDPILDIARRHNLKVVEDVSHAQGGLYKGRRLGTIGDVAGMSLMTGKSFAIGEAGILTTDDREIYERALAWGHYERFVDGNIETPALKPFVGMPLGGYKYRMHQLSSAMGRVQLRHYDERCTEIRRALDYFWEQLEGIPALRPHRIDGSEGSNMAGWYHPVGLYDPAALGGLSVSRFAEAVRAEGAFCLAGCNAPLHRHPVFNECDIYGNGQPTRIAHAAWDVREGQKTLPVTERINGYVCTVPWFKHYRPAEIDEYVAAFRKVLLNYESLLTDDVAESGEQDGRVGLSARG